jgi:hypothetical protein
MSGPAQHFKGAGPGRNSAQAPGPGTALAWTVECTVQKSLNCSRYNVFASKGDWNYLSFSFNVLLMLRNIWLIELHNLKVHWPQIQWKIFLSMELVFESAVGSSRFDCKLTTSWNVKIGTKQIHCRQQPLSSLYTYMYRPRSLLDATNYKICEAWRRSAFYLLYWIWLNQFNRSWFFLLFGAFRLLRNLVVVS